MHIVHLWDKGTRFPQMISEGLAAQAGIELTVNKPVLCYGETLIPAAKNLQDELIKAEYIFRSNDEHFDIPEIDNFLDEHSLWKKVVYYDFKDSCQVDLPRLKQCSAYAKRSWTKGIHRKALPRFIPPLFPLNYSLLSAYKEIDQKKERDIDVVCAFEDSPAIGKRRYNLIQEVKAANFQNSHIGLIKGGEDMRKAIFIPRENNPYIDYLSLLGRAKIIFTAFPDMQDGDSRIWEALSSGALIVADQCKIPMSHPLVHLEHCILFDAMNPQSIKEAIVLAKYYLENEKKRAELAAAGKAFVEKYHSPAERMAELLDWLASRSKEKIPSGT